MDPKRPDRMPVLVLSGFLGAGKTTFLNQLLRAQALADSMVIVNEFGDAGLDSLFLEAESEAQGSGLMIEELTSGCLCCTLQGPLVTTLEDLLRARDNGRIKPFKQLIIETTGLADPAPFWAHSPNTPTCRCATWLAASSPWWTPHKRWPNWMPQPEATAQIAVADVLALSKTDLVDEKTMDQLNTALSARNPHAARRTTIELARDTAWLESLLAQASPITPSPIVPATDNPHSHHHAHDHQHAFSVVLETDGSAGESRACHGHGPARDEPAG
jgi:G3E family GTPase